MHPDRKIGIAMGILLVGVVAALFFRNEPLSVDDSLSVRRERELNERLKERDVAVYLESDNEDSVEEGEEPQWTLPEILGTLKSSDQALPIAVRNNSEEAVEQQERNPPPFSPPVRDGVALSDENRTSTTGRRHSDQFSELELSVHGENDSAGQNRSQDDLAREHMFDEYKVQYGDTLSGISKRFLGSHQRYSEIYDANKDRIDNPDRLKVGTAIRIPRVIR